MRKLYVLLLALFLFFSNTINAQVTGIKNIPGDYATVAAAITDLNTNGVGSGGATINIAGGYTETAPSGGYVLGSTVLNASLSAANQLTIKKGSGANPLLTAYTGGTSTTSDGIFKIQGADYVTIDGINLQENAANTGTALMEWGYALVNLNGTTPFDGCQFVTIKNCSITLNKINPNGATGIYTGHNTASSGTALTITTAFDTHSNNKFYGNTISNVDFGIYLSGYSDSAPYSLYDQNNEIGGNSQATGNTVTNCGGNSAFNNFCIVAVANNNCNVSNNTVDNAAGGINNTTNLYGIYVWGTNATFTVNNNNITVKEASSSTSNAVAGIYSNSGGTNITAQRNTVNVFEISGNAVPAYGIYFTNSNNITITNNNVSVTQSLSGTTYGINSGATGTVNITSDTIQATTTAALTSAFYMIYAGSTAVGGTTISNNRFSNISINTTGNAYVIYSNSATTNVTAANNSTMGNFTYSGTSGTVYGYYNFGGPGSGTSNITGNNFSNITLSGSAAFYGVYQATTISQIEIVNNNTINNIAAGTGTIIGIHHNYGAAGSSCNSNTVSGITATGTITGIQLGNTTASLGLIVANNNVNTLSTTGASTVNGILHTSGNATNIYKNKIYNLQATNASGFVYGMTVSGGLVVTVYNNLIGDLKTPSTSSSFSAVIGINITSTTATSNINVYYNTVYLSATSTGTNFHTSGIYHTTSTTSSTAAIDLRNNIITNLSIPNGTGLTVAYRRSSSALTNYASTSNNNLFYAGTPGANKLIFYDGTNSDQTLSSYQARVNPRDGVSVTENPPFLSTSGSNINFLHINTAVPTQIESGAVNISGITDDYDANIRQGNAGYSGTGLAPDIGACEFNGIGSYSCTTPNPGNTTTTANSICNGTSITLGVANSTTGNGVSYVWQSAPNNGGVPGTFTNISGTSFQNTITPINDSTWYRAVVTCFNGPVSTPSNPIMITFSQRVTSTTPGAICSNSGTVTLAATGTGNTINWYTAQNGGLPIGSGSAFVTPVISSTTTYYVAAGTQSIATGNGTIGAGATTSSTGGSPFYHTWGGLQTQYIMTASELSSAGLVAGNITALALKVNSIGSGTFGGFAIGLGNTNQATFSTGTAITGLTQVYTGPGANGAQTLIVGTNTFTFSTPFNWDGTSNLVVKFCWSNQNTGGTSATVVTDVQTVNRGMYIYADNQTASAMCSATTGPVGGSGNSATTTTRPQFVLTAQIANSCFSARVPVVATLNTPPAISLSPSSIVNICTGQSATISASSGNSGYSYTWNPGNLPGAVQTVNPVNTTTYVVSAVDNSGGVNNGCSRTDSIKVIVNPTPTSLTISPATPQICNGSIQQLTASGGTLPGTLSPIVSSTTVSSYGNPFRTLWGCSKLQFIYTASELTAAGFTANAQISSVTFNVTAVGGQVPNLTIGMAHTSFSSFATTSFVSGLTTVYSTSTGFTPLLGLNTFTFSTPFTWNGTSNIIFEACFASNTSGNSSSTVSAVATVTNSVLHGTTDNTPGYCTSATTGSQDNNRPYVLLGYSASNPVKWYPATGLYTDAGATVPYAGTSIRTVYAKPSTSITYIAQATTAGGCASTGSVVLLVDQTPTPAISPSNTTICNGQIQQLTVSSNSNAASKTTSSGTISIAVPDNDPGGATHTISMSGIPAGAIISNISVSLNMTHPNDGDMIFNLKGPNGNVLNLINRRGGNGQNFANTSFSSQSGLPAISTGSAPFIGTFNPDGITGVGPTGYTSNVILFTGLFSVPNGNWTLAMQDAAAGNTGTLTSWSLTIYYFIPDNYIWSPVTELYSDAGATTPYAGTNLATVYAKPTITRTYAVTASTTGGCSGTANAIVNVKQLPAITNQPIDQNVCPAQTVIFTVIATGNGLTYQWRKNGVNLSNGGNISGANTATLSITNIAVSDNGNYDVVVSGDCPPPTTSTPAVLTVGAAPPITSQPQNQIACQGNTVSFSVSTSTPGVTYQWRKNGVNLVTDNVHIFGATTNTLTIVNVIASDAANYDVVLTNNCSQSTTSNVAVLTFSLADRWLGVSNTDWNNPLNWCSGVPNNITDVVILSGTPFSPILSATNEVRNLQIDAGATVTMTASGWLNIYGNVLTINGTFNTVSGTVGFKNSANLNIPGLTVDNVVMDGSGGITLTGNMNITTALTLTKGNITLGNNNLVMTGGSIGSALSHIVTNGNGVVVNSNVGVATVVFPIGPTVTNYNPVQIANGQGLTYTARVAVGVPATLANAARAINRTWTINANDVPANPVSLTLGYADADANLSCTPTASMEVGYYNGTAWVLATPSGGSMPMGTATARLVYTTSKNFGTMVVANIGGLLTPLATPNLNADIYSVRLLPNIVKQQSVLRVFTRRAMNVEWNVTDLQGRVIMKFNRGILAGQNDIPLDLGRLATGTYQIVGYTDKGITNVVKFVRL
jgi:subtilisin-like proprotein convertase family protein